MKNKPRFSFFLILLFIAFLAFVVFIGFGNGHLLSYRNIDKGLDLSGGVYIVYEAKEEVLEDDESLEDEESISADEDLSTDDESSLADEDLSADDESSLADEDLSTDDTSSLADENLSADDTSSLADEDLGADDISSLADEDLSTDDTSSLADEDLSADDASSLADEDLGADDMSISADETEITESIESTSLEDESDDLTSAEDEATTSTKSKTSEPTWNEKMNTVVSMLQQRLDKKGFTEANVYKEGTNRVRVEIPGIDDIEQAIEEIGQTAKLTITNISGDVLVDGKHITNAYKSAVTTATGYQQIVVNIEFDEQGTEDFAKATEENLDSILFIYLDDSIISAPTVNEVITDGKAMITGNFDSASAEELASLLRAGSLPLELEILETNTVGATLGASALTRSIIGGVIGFVLILLFMLLFYKIKGIAANLALIIYILAELILLNFFNVTLTLHGIAGIILSIGMAVDANVIIFERIKEELSTGRNVKIAINKGFSRAFPAILDSNITTIIAGIILYILGTGSIKGFAQTLILGIVLSMFTALLVTKFILITLYNLGLKNPKLYGAK